MPAAKNATVSNSKGDFVVHFSNFNEGQAPTAHLDPLTQIGTGGQYSVAKNVDVVTTPGLLTQGPGISPIANGTEAGALKSLMNFILDTPFSAGKTYGVSDTKLHQITPAAITNTGIWPHAITSAVTGSSVIAFQGKIYYFYNTAGGGDCGTYDGTTTFVDAYFSVVPTGAAALQNAPHPVAVKQDIMLFGNGRYVGSFVSTGATLAPTLLDFGVNAQVVDIIFFANQWYIAVNVGTTVSTDRHYSSIYLYAAPATGGTLANEIGVGTQRIGFMALLEGIVYVAFQDLTSEGGFCIGYISGTTIKPLQYFTGTLPTFAQKSLYNNTIIFTSNGQVYSIGAATEKLPLQISQLAKAGF